MSPTRTVVLEPVERVEVEEDARVERRTRLVGSVALVVLLSICLAYLSTAFLVRRHVLDGSTYSGALAEAGAYDRVYTEVLTDPAMKDLVEDLLGHLDVDPSLATDVAVTTTNALRWALPPSRVQVGTDAFIHDTVAYLRGDADEYRPTVALDGVLDRIDDAAVTFTRTILGRARVVEYHTIEEFQVAVEEFADSLTAGRVPGSVPVLTGAEFDVDEVVDIILDAADAPDDSELRTRVAATVAAGESDDALVDAVVDDVVPFVRREVAQLVRVDGDGRFDVVGEVTDRARETTGSATVSLAGVRDALRWFGPAVLVVVGGVGLVAIGGLIALNRGRSRRLALMIGAGFGGASILLLVGGRLVGRVLAGPLDAATGTGPGTWNLPDGIRGVLVDVAAILGGDLREQVLGVAAALALAAVAAGFAAVAVHLVRGAKAVAGAAVEAVRSRARTGTGFVAGAACVGLLVSATVVTDSSVDVADAERCNGHAELCDRAYDEVAYAATHNSMSSPGVVHVWPEQDGDITEQLDAGIRALLIDTHYWRRIDGAADLIGEVDASEVPVSLPVAQEVIDAAGSLAEGRPGTFLCHSECIYGALPFVDALVAIGAWMEANPREVVTLIIQDDISVDDTVAAFEESGLDDLVYEGEGPWPTLGELIDDGHRLVVFAEFSGGSPAWYRDAWVAMQDTPFGFASPSDMSCDPNRGEGDPSLFLLNHWVSRFTPSRTDAAVLNEHGFLLDRARRCRDERGLDPNFLAVDFYNIGDVVGVVDELNGVG